MVDLFDTAFLKKLELLTLSARRALVGQSMGEQRSRRLGSSVEFADYRQYTPGDDFRRIDWNAYARFDNLLLKLFREEEDLSLYLLCDASASMDFGKPGKFDYARKVAAALAYIALHNGDRVSLYMLGDDNAGEQAQPIRDSLRSRRGRGTIFEVFDFLQAATTGGATDLSACVQYLISGSVKPGIVVIISDMLLDDGYDHALKRLAYEKFQPMIVHVMAPQEITPDISGDLRLSDSETGHQVDVSPSKRMLDAYQKQLALFRRRVDNFARRHATDYVFAATDTAFEELVLQWMRTANMLS